MQGQIVMSTSEFDKLAIQKMKYQDA